MENMWIPKIEVESASGTREISLATRHFMNRRIFISGEITENTANSFISQLMYLEQESSEPVTIYINSPGGQVNAGMVIYDAVQGSRIPINMLCTGMAASMAAVILAGGQPGRRYILKHSKVMIHEPLISQGVGGSATSIQNISESILETKHMVNEILAWHTGRKVDEINKATAYDNYMNAAEAVDFGICDQISKDLFLRA